MLNFFILVHDRANLTCASTLVANKIWDELKTRAFLASYFVNGRIVALGKSGQAFDVDILKCNKVYLLIIIFL